MSDRADKCKHEKVIPKFDSGAWNTMSALEIRKKYPRFYGKCPDCDYLGVIYASFEHYVAGDW